MGVVRLVQAGAPMTDRDTLELRVGRLLRCLAASGNVVSTELVRACVNDVTEALGVGSAQEESDE